MASNSSETYWDLHNLPFEVMMKGLQEMTRIHDSTIITQHAKSALNFYVGNPICEASIAYSIKVFINAMRMPTDKTTVKLNELPINFGNYLFFPMKIRNRGNLSENVEDKPPILEPIKKLFWTPIQIPR